MNSISTLAASTRVTKRHKIAYTSVLYALAMLLVILAGIGWWGAIVMGLVGYVAVIYCLDFDLRYEEWIVFPLYAILSSVTFYTWMSQYGFSDPARLAVACTIFGLAVYALILTLNILNISTVRILPLARTAKSVLSFMGVLLSFSMLQLAVIGQPSLINWVVGTGGISFLVAWPLIWTSINKKIRLLPSIGWASLVAILQMQLAALTGWWPISYMTSLFLSILLFITLGVLHIQELKQVGGVEKRQYVILAVVISIGFYLASQW